MDKVATPIAATECVPVAVALHPEPRTVTLEAAKAELQTLPYLYEQDEVKPTHATDSLPTADALHSDTHNPTFVRATLEPQRCLLRHEDCSQMRAQSHS